MKLRARTFFLMYVVCVQSMLCPPVPAISCATIHRDPLWSRLAACPLYVPPWPEKVVSSEQVSGYFQWIIVEEHCSLRMYKRDGSAYHALPFAAGSYFVNTIGWLDKMYVGLCTCTARCDGIKLGAACDACSNMGGALCDAADGLGRCSRRTCARACVRSAECVDPRASQCSNGVCVACRSDVQCTHLPSSGRCVKRRGRGVCQPCGRDEFPCIRSALACIPLAHSCDSKNDCGNWSDEWECSCNTNAQCMTPAKPYCKNGRCSRGPRPPTTRCALIKRINAPRGLIVRNNTKLRLQIRHGHVKKTHVAARCSLTLFLRKGRSPLLKVVISNGIYVLADSIGNVDARAASCRCAKQE